MDETILVIEDERSLQETLAYNLKKQGYNVETSGDGQSGVEAARRLQPDLIILDLMLPVFDGFEVCRIVRQEMNVPIIMLTARDEELDRIVGLEMGADDYIIKPFSMRELMARVKAQLRRVRLIRSEAQTTSPESKDALVFGNLELDTLRREMRIDGKPMAVKPKEFDLMLFLARHRGQALSRQLILERVWGWDFVGGSRTVDVHIRWLREKIEPDISRPSRIVTIYGEGYRFDG